VVIKKISFESSRVSKASQPGYELEGREIELSRVFGIGRCCMRAIRALGCEKRTSRVIWSDNEIVMNLLPGYE
jgi:hypothetical protein